MFLTCVVYGNDYPKKLCNFILNINYEMTNFKIKIGKYLINAKYHIFCLFQIKGYFPFGKALVPQTCLLII